MSGGGGGKATRSSSSKCLCGEAKWSRAIGGGDGDGGWGEARGDVDDCASEVVGARATFSRTGLDGSSLPRQKMRTCNKYTRRFVRAELYELVARAPSLQDARNRAHVQDVPNADERRDSSGWRFLCIAAVCRRHDDDDDDAANGETRRTWESLRSADSIAERGRRRRFVCAQPQRH